MKILFITHLYHPAIGGAERVFRRIAEGLAGLGHDVTVLTSDALSTDHYYDHAPSGIPLREILGGVEIIRESVDIPAYKRLRIFDRTARRLGRIGALGRPLTFGPHFRAAFRKVQGRDYDAIMAGPTPTSAIFYGLAYKWTHRGARLILFPHLHIQDRLHRTCINRWTLRRADRVLVLTEVEKRYLLRKRIRESKIVRIVNAVDDHVFEAGVSPENGLKDYVLYLGQEGGHKRIPLLIRAMSRLWDRGCVNPLVIAGARTDYSVTVDKTIAQLPERHRRMIHRFNDIPEERKAALIDHGRVLVNPSSFEAFGIVFLEAWARRKPVIGADIPAVREIVGDGKKGLLFKDKDGLDLEKKIEMMLGDRGMAEKMGQAGYKDVAAHYRWDQVVKNIEAVAAGR